MFDYIVVGAGTAGCTLAARLTEDPAVQVLLMEAGPPARKPEIWRPSAFPALAASEIDWNDSTEPQEHLNGRRLAWTRGRVLGGSGSIGAMIHLRGCRADFDRWRDPGNPGWGFDELEQFWRDPRSGKTTEPNELTEVFLDACNARGLPRYTDLSGPCHEGAGLLPAARINGTRWSPMSGFLEPALKRGNLTVWTGTQAARVLIESGRATGIEYQLKGGRHKVQVQREVILCAGAVGSAQLLLLSGVGPAAQLERLKVPLVADISGVGENLQDHVAVVLRWTCTQPVSLDGSATLKNKLRYRFRREGPLASNLIEAGAFFKSSKGAEGCDLAILFAPLYSLNHGLAATPQQRGFTLLAALLDPASKGTVSLKSSDPLETPRIDPRYLSQPADRERLKLAAEKARAIVEAPAFGQYRGSGSALDIEERTISLHHAAGTCRMGTGESAVVDAELKVRGIESLRVADASIMPVLPRTAPNATVVVIAEKAARLIRGR